MKFAFDAPGRWDYFRFLREHAAVHAPLWRPGYRAFQAAMSFVALALGYRGYEALRGRYRGSTSLKHWRAEWIGDEKAEVAAIPAHVPERAASARAGQHA